MATPVSPRPQPRAPVASATSPWRPSLRTCLVVLALAALLPALLAAALALGRAASAYREASQARLLDTARTLARAVENELANRYMVMRTLAAPPTTRVAAADVAVTRELWLRRWGTELGGELQAAAELDARTLADPAAGAVIRATLDTALRTGRTEVSNLYADAAVAGPRIAIAAPGVAGAAAESGALVLEIAPQRLVRALQSRTSEASALLIAVTDGSGRIVARSQDAAHAVGKPVPDWARLQALGTDHGLFEARTVEGQPIVFAFEKLRDTPGWVVVVGEPLAVFDARWQEPLIGLAAGGAVALGLSLLAVAWLTRLILRPVQALVTHARQVADNRPAPTAADPAPSAIDEFETLRSSLATADRVLQQRGEAERASSLALQASEQRYRTLVESGALMFWRCDARGRLTAADGWHELTGVAEPQALGAGWQAHLHADDRRATRAAWRAAQAPGRALDVECRIRTAGGDWRWVRARGAPIVGDRGEVTEWVGVLEDVDERRRAQARVTHMAHHDALTGLPNRALLQERLMQAIGRARRGHPSAMLCVDLDRFKEVNDSLGHGVGDALLREVTTRLCALMREGDTVARLGGDEFAVVQASVAEPAQAAALALRLIDELSSPYQVAGHQVVIGASVGVMMIAGHDGVVDHLLRSADMAMYRAKQEGRGRFAFFEPGMDARMQQRRQMELDLRRALEREEFVVHYQPLVDTRTRTLSGVEALLRWQHPERGLVLPDEFIGLAEEIGLITRIGEWVLRRACTDALIWPECPRIVAVNVSAVQLADKAFVPAVARVLADTGLAPQRLELEVSEKVVLREGTAALDTLRALKALGVMIAMDDFGTGQTSLGCLHSVPFDKVKIDRSFVSNLGLRQDANAIVRAVTGLCDGLGITTVAEGVETEAQFDMLLAEECTEVQGFLFSAAAPASEIPGLCRALAIEAA